MASTTTSGTTTCPSCASPASGRFCASCGAPLEGAVCGACHAALTPGAKFCHRCGTAVGAVPATPAGAGAGAGGATSSGFPAALPWAVAAIALLALIALVAGQNFGRRPASEPGSATEAAAAPAEGPAPVRAPDISALSPRERADRLYDRIMRLDSEGKKDSVQFFAQMAISAYQMLPEQDLDTRYDMGRIAEVAGAVPLARAQADSILAADSTHLLGLILAISTARDANDTAAARALERRLVAAQQSELATNRPEYQRHEREIAAAIDDARKQQ